MIQSFRIEGKLPSLNDYTKACRTNRYAGAKMKEEAETMIGIYASGVVPIQQPVKIRFHWIEGDLKRDLDNIAFSKKFILDALVKRQILPNDNRKWVKGFVDSFIVTKNHWGCIVTLEEEG